MRLWIQIQIISPEWLAYITKFIVNLNFCEACFKLIHDKKKTQHKKEKIDPFIPVDIKCPEHPRIVMDLFCSDEKGKIYIFIIYL